MHAFKTEVDLGSQKVSIASAEIIVNKMPTIGPKKNTNYIIITLKTDDKKKIAEKYTMEKVQFPSCTKRFVTGAPEKRGDVCIVRNLPNWVGKGLLVVITLKDSKGNTHMIRTTSSVMEVH
jgi:hypothetical protein